MDDYIYGKNPVLEALEAGHETNKLLVLDQSRDKTIQKIIDLAKSRNILIQFSDRKQLDRLSNGENHQGVIAFISPYEYCTVEDILMEAHRKGDAPFIVVCDEITDPHNLGSIIRSANAAGVHGVIVPKRRSAAVTSTVVKTSCGAIEHVKVARVTNITQTLNMLKKEGVWICGTAMGAPVYHQTNLKGPIAIIVGNEGSGMGRLVRETCDFMVSLPMLGQVESLNAAVASAIVMYEVVRQRNS